MSRWLYILITASILISSNAFCFQGAEVALFTPRIFVDQKLQQFFSTQALPSSFQMGNFDLSVDPLTWHLTNAQLQLQAKYQSGSVTPQTYDLSAQQMKMLITVDHLDVDQIIQRNVNGAIINVHVKATCGPLTLSQNNAEASAQFGFVTAGTAINTEIKSFDLAWAPGSWTVSDISCQGPEGFDVTFKEQLLEQLKTADGVKTFVQQALQNEIQSVVTTTVNELVRPNALPVPQSPVPLTMQLREVQTSDQGVLVAGVLIWSGHEDETDIRPLPLKEIPSGVLASVQPVLLSETAAWNDLIQAEIQAGPSLLEVHLNQIESFKNLLNCRFLQLFVWPDLFHYHDDSPFNLEIQNPKSFNLVWNSNGSARFKVSASGWIESARDSKTWKYLLVQGQFAGTANPKISKGHLNLQIAGDQSQFAVKFDPDYVQAFKPNEHLSDSIKTSLQSYLQSGISFSADLPEFDLGGFGIAQFDGWKVVGTADDASALILIPLSLSPKTQN